MSPARDKAKLIPLPADVQLMVADDGVFLGFFPDNAEPGIINVEELAFTNSLGIKARATLAMWAVEQRKRAATSANVSER